MDILSHAFSGLAISTVAASFSSGGLKRKLGIMLLGLFAGALPDLDAVSLWSKFDDSIGHVLNLKHTGKQIYFGKLLYSHHGALHSLTLAFLIPMIFVLSLALGKRVINKTPFNSTIRKNMIKMITFFLAFSIHLLEDMPTPACVWGGVNFLWPSSAYYGGFGKIWWWNNYDIFLIILSIIVLNLAIHSINTVKKIPVKKITSGIFIIGVSLTIFQINTRGFDFSYTGHSPKYQEFEKQSKSIQRNILGERLYQIMTGFDNSISLNF